MKCALLRGGLCFVKRAGIFLNFVPFKDTCHSYQMGSVDPNLKAVSAFTQRIVSDNGIY